MLNHSAGPKSGGEETKMLYRIWESISWHLGLWNAAYRTRKLREEFPGLYNHIYEESF